MDMWRRKRRRWLRCGALLGLAVCLLGACKGGDKDDKAGDRKPDWSYCEDQSKWNRWEALVAQYRWDDEMVELHALRLGLCSMIFTEQLEPERGIELFNKAYYAWMEKTVRLQTAAEEARQKKARRKRAKQAGQAPLRPGATTGGAVE